MTETIHTTREIEALIPHRWPFLLVDRIVEYDADRGNPWVPYPFSFESWRREAVRAGYTEPRVIGRVPSRFLGAIYSAVAEIPTGLVHSAPQGADREE